MLVYGTGDMCSSGQTADSDEAAPLFRYDCAPGFRDDLARWSRSFAGMIVVISSGVDVKHFGPLFGAGFRR